MSVKRKINRKHEWEALQPWQRSRVNRHPNFDVYGMAKHLTQQCFMKAAYQSGGCRAYKSGGIVRAQSGEHMYDAVERFTRAFTNNAPSSD